MNLPLQIGAILTHRRRSTYTTSPRASGILSKRPARFRPRDDSSVLVPPGPMTNLHTTCEQQHLTLRVHLTIKSYLYGGFAAEGPGGFDDAYVLSLPSFKWINVFNTGNGTTTFSHGACSASVIDRDQMLIIGGWFTNLSYTDCDAQNSQGQHNSKIGKL
jgi:hypothetical protein